MTTPPDPVEMLTNFVREVGISWSDNDSREFYAALEAAGYRIAGPEQQDALDEVIHKLEIIDRSFAKEFWDTMHAKLPRYGGE